MIGFKIYYDKATGNEILTLPETHNAKTLETTKEQDFAIYPVLQARGPESVEVMQLAYGENRNAFQLANSWKVNVETGELEFEYPNYGPSYEERIAALQKDKLKLEEELTAVQDENANLFLQNAMQDMTIENQNLVISTMQDETADLMVKVAIIEMGAL